MIIQKGVVKKGQGRAGELGFKTLNIDNLSEIHPGIYAGRVTYRDQVFDAVLYVGDKSQETLEAHLFDFDRDVYGAEVSIEVLHKLRDDQVVADIGSLKQLIAEDCNNAKKFFAQLK